MRMDNSSDEPLPDSRSFVRGLAGASLSPERILRLARSDAALFAALTLVLVAPFFVFETIPLYDLPNHIARQHILFGDGAPGASVYYSAHWRLIPNLAMEGFVFALHPLMSVDVGVRAFLAATAAQLFLGTVALNRALFGDSGRFALAACLSAYNGPFLFGFVNLAFGMGMALWVFALWLRWRRHSASVPVFEIESALVRDHEPGRITHLEALRYRASAARMYRSFQSIPRYSVCANCGALVPGPQPTSRTRRTARRSLCAAIGENFLSTCPLIQSR